MIGHAFDAHHRIGAQARGQLLDQSRQGFDGVFARGKKRAFGLAFIHDGRRFEREFEYRRLEFEARQALAHERGQAHGIVAGRGQRDRQRGRRDRIPGPSIVMQHQREAAHGGASRSQPTRQLREQPLGGEHQRFGALDARHQFDARIETRRRYEHDLRVGPGARGARHFVEQSDTEATRESLLGQPTQIGERAATDAIEAIEIIPRRIEVRDRQGIERGGEAVVSCGLLLDCDVLREQPRAVRGGCFGHRDLETLHAQGRDDVFLQGAATAEEFQARGDFHHESRYAQRNDRREVQGCERRFGQGLAFVFEIARDQDQVGPHCERRCHRLPGEHAAQLGGVGRDGDEAPTAIEVGDGQRGVDTVGPAAQDAVKRQRRTMNGQPVHA